MRHLILALMSCCLSCVSVWAAELRITQTAGVVSVSAAAYAATISPSGDLALTMSGVKGPTAAFPRDLGAVEVNVRGNLVAVRAGKARSEWTFSESGLQLVSEGFPFEWAVGDQVTLVFGREQKNQVWTKDVCVEHSQGLALRDTVAMTWSKGFHIMGQRGVPSAYCTGEVANGARFEFSAELGKPVAGVTLLGAISIGAVGDDLAPLRAGGNEVGEITHFPNPAAVVLRTTQATRSAQAISATTTLTVLDHYVAGRAVATLEQPTTISVDKPTELTWKLPKLGPGFYYVIARSVLDGQVARESKLTITVDLPNYDRPLSRPADFAAFWKAQDELLATIPAAPRLERLRDSGDEAWLLTLTLPDGSPVRGVFTKPAAVQGKTIAHLAGCITSQLDDRIKEVAQPGFVSDGINLLICLPEDATFNRWVSARDNNLLASVQTFLRGIDWLATRPEVDPARIYVSSASRGGPLVVISAARRPANVCAADVMIPTSAGIGWTDRPYFGWGQPNGYDPSKAESVAAFAAMGAYVDPINHAPEVKAPIFLTYGLDDVGLSPCPGIEAIYHHLGSSWKRISRDHGGHYRSQGYDRLHAQLAAKVGLTGGPVDQTRTLNEH
jgi:cephalosporin-C deacetylase-like acetyl esterase